MSKLGLAISIASKAFENTLDKGGKPYILHCLWVMNKVRHLGEEAMITAILHDIIEDTDENSETNYTFAKLTELGFSDNVIGNLHLLTHNKETPYDEYIKAISVSKIATEVKKADLEHNSNITRLKGLRKKDFDRLEKYSRAFIYLSN
ncbi:MAG: GTP pyrophosphokinase [Micavibrio sp.]|nr:GTP pyrophosphokinase [Micavibrio sp.]